MSDETTQPETPAAPSLSIQDLVGVVKIIQVVAQRGAIQAQEMGQVGPLYDRLIAFLDANGALQRPAAEPAAPEENPQ